jgi:hypothetical protein
MYGKVEYDPMADAHLCEECSRWYRALARHITRHHRITTREYKVKWGLNLNEPLIGETVRAKLRQAAYDKGTFNNVGPGAGQNWRFKAGDNRKFYRRSEQSKRRLRVLRLMSKSKLRLKKRP